MGEKTSLRTHVDSEKPVHGDFGTAARNFDRAVSTGKCPAIIELAYYSTVLSTGQDAVTRSSRKTHRDRERGLRYDAYK